MARVSRTLPMVLAFACSVVVARADGACGPRYVAPGGAGAPSACTDPGAPCGSIDYAIAIACDNDTVNVAGGDYVEDIVITHPVVVKGTAGNPLYLHVAGTGTTDVVKILSGNVTWQGITVWHTPAQAGMRIGDAAHPNLRNIMLSNATFRDGLRVGLVIDRTGTGSMNWLAGVIVHNVVGDGTPGSGIGVLMTGGNSRWQILSSLAAHGIDSNGGAGIRIEAAPDGTPNAQIHIVGIRMYGNGNDATADGVAAIEAHGTSDLQVEGNEIYDHTGGAAIVLDGAQGGGVWCNRVHDGAGGLVLTGASSGVSVHANEFTNLSGTALLVDADPGTGIAVNENLFHGNGGLAVERRGAATLDATHDWFGAAGGPGSEPGGVDGVLGAVATDRFVARGDQPLLVRRAMNSGWYPAPYSACYDTLQGAIDAASPGALVLVGEGTFGEAIRLGKPLDIEGVTGGTACPSTIVDVASKTGPAFQVKNVDGAHVRSLTIRGAGGTTPCGQDGAPSEVGLDLVNVTRSEFRDLCLGNDGVTDVALRCGSSGNLLAKITIDGRKTSVPGCADLSREGVLVDATPDATLCAAPAAPAGNALDAIATTNVARGIVLRGASATTITGADLAVTAAAAWGPLTAGIVVEASDGTTITGARIGNAGMVEAIRLTGRPAGAAYGPALDTSATTITGSTLALATTGVHVHHAADDEGSVTGTTLTCNAITQGDTGVLVDPGTSVQLAHDTIAGHTSAGVVNGGPDPVDARTNWWGDPSGPSGAGGSGDPVVGNVDAAQWLPSSPLVDSDGDGLTACAGDCDDTRADVHPGAPEVCDAGVQLDNDCNGFVNDGIAPPSGVPSMSFAATLSWSASAGATGYDLVRGGLGALEASGGDYALGITSCLVNDGPATGYDDADRPADGDGFFYLVRAENCAGVTTFDSPDPGLARSRDPGIAASPNACP